MEQVGFHGECYIVEILNVSTKNLVNWLYAIASDILAWRSYVVAPITEELVFRACMIPLLLCAGFEVYSIIFLSPVLFSLAHLNHLMELYYKGHSFSQAVVIVGFQLGYTVIFGWYSSFLFIRTGHLLPSVVVHIFCNILGLPVIFSSRQQVVVFLSFVAGTIAFFLLLFPATSPDLYNDDTQDCKCWHVFCRGTDM